MQFLDLRNLQHVRQLGQDGMEPHQARGLTVVVDAAPGEPGLEEALGRLVVLVRVHAQWLLGARLQGVRIENSPIICGCHLVRTVNI
jgi:hypothetical protein